MGVGMVLRDRSAVGTELPDPEGTGIEDSGLVPQIYNMLCSGWSSWQVVIVLAQTEGITLDEGAVRAYAERIPQDRFLPATSLIKHFQGIKVITDPLGEMEMLLRLCQERLSTQLEEEQGAEAEEAYKLRTRINADINAYWRKLREFAELQDRLGITGFIKAAKGPGQRGGPTLADIIGVKLTERTVELQTKQGACPDPRSGRGEGADTNPSDVIDGEAQEVSEPEQLGVEATDAI